MTKQETILEYIKSNPGQTSVEISKGTGILYGTVKTSVCTLCGRDDIQMMNADKKQSTYKAMSPNVKLFLMPLHQRQVSR